MLYQLYVNQHKTKEECSKILNVPINIIMRGIKNYNIDFKDRKDKHYEIIEQLKDLYINQLKTQEECGEILGISKAIVHKLLKKYNIKDAKKIGI